MASAETFEKMTKRESSHLPGPGGQISATKGEKRKNLLAAGWRGCGE